MCAFGTVRGLCVPTCCLSEPGFSGLAASHLYVFSQDRQQCLSATQNIYSLNNPVIPY